MTKSIRNLKIALSLCLAACIVFSLVACSGSGSSGDSLPASASGVISGEIITTEAGNEIPEIKLPENTTIRVLGIDQPQFREGGSVASFLKKYYGVSIEQQITAQTDFYSTLAAEVLAGTPPDVVIAYGGFPSLILSDVIQPIDNVVDYSIPSLAHLQPSYEQYVYEGKHYYMPWISTVQSYVYYNTKIMEDNELTSPRDLYNKGEWTWDKMAEYAKKLNIDQNSDGTAERWGLVTVNWHDARFIYTTDTSLVKEQDGKLVSNLSDPKIEKALTFLSDLTLKDKVSSPNRDANYALEQMNNGTAAMILGPDFWSGTDSAMPDLKKAKQFEYAPFPKEPGATTHIVSGKNIGYYLPKGSKNNALVNAFIVSCVVAMEEEKSEGTELYKKEMDKRLKVWAEYGYDEEYFAQDLSFKNKANKDLKKIDDPYWELLEINSVYDSILGSGAQKENVTPITFQQALALYEPALTEQIKTIFGK